MIDIDITITILDIIHRPVSYLKTRLNSTGLSVPHRKHITSPLRVQQVNGIYRFVRTSQETHYVSSPSQTG
jgi:hypothetical protein